jgi:hypothetical protein
MSPRLAPLGLIACLCAAPALAAQKKRAPEQPPLKLAEKVDLENKRALSLLSFEIAMPDADPAKAVIVAKLEKPLLGGARIDLPLAGAKGCVFEARWQFEDAADAGSLDLCSDAHIVLID